MPPGGAGKGSDTSGTPSISFYCDDVQKTVAELKGRGVEFVEPVKDMGFGLVTHFKAQGDFVMQLYQPKYAKGSAARPQIAETPHPTRRSVHPMVQSKATSVEGVSCRVTRGPSPGLGGRGKVVLKNLDKDYEEGIQYGMIGYYVPHRVYPPGYHCDPKQPLPFATLGSQKNHMALYLMCIYGDSATLEWFRQAWAKRARSSTWERRVCGSKKSTTWRSR